MIKALRAFAVRWEGRAQRDGSGRGTPRERVAAGEQWRPESSGLLRESPPEAAVIGEWWRLWLADAVAVLPDGARQGNTGAVGEVGVRRGVQHDQVRSRARGQVADIRAAQGQGAARGR